MSKVSLKVVVAGRTYPLSVKESEQDAILAAAKEINDSIKVLQDNYAVKDIQDLLAMSALQIGTKTQQNPSVSGNVNASEDTDKLKQKLLDLTALVDKEL